MKIRFRGVGDAQRIGNMVLEHPTCPAKGEEIDLSDDGNAEDCWTVRTVIHTPCAEYDAYVVVGALH